MTIFDHSTLKAASVEKLDIWRCGDGCGFHLRAGNVVMTFTNEELEAFLHAAGGCYLGETCAHVEVPADEARSPDKARKHQTIMPTTLSSVLEH
jgi:hypothetical protein